MQIIIVAGGGGARLWPSSNSKIPKQFVKIIGEKSSLEHVYEYLVSDFDKENIWINTNQKYADMVSDLIPGFDSAHLLLEPEKRDNFAAVSAQAAVLSHKFGDKEPLIFVTSDEFMLNHESVEKYKSAIKKIASALEKNTFEVVTMGVKPISPNPNYGYLELNPEDKDGYYSDVVKVARFCEKPDVETAQKFLEKGNYIWNKFNPSFTFATLKKYLSVYDPISYEILIEIERTGIIKPEEYAKLTKTSFDYGFMEKVPNMGVIGIDIDDWVDVGNWEIAGKYMPEIDNTNNYIQVSGKNNKVMSHIPERKIAFIGVSNLILVESEEGILVIDPSFSAEVKKVAEYFENKIL
jgi:mannose-1-phosphate guanylyltransferase